MDEELRWIARATGAKTVDRGERIQSLWSGYGEIYRVHLSGARTRTAIVKSVKPPQRRTSSASHVRKVNSYRVELAWYRDFAARCDDTCRVPVLFDGTISEGRPGAFEGALFVLEDLDPAGFSERRRRGPSPAEIDRCLSWLASFHARFLGTSPEGLWPRGTYWHLATRAEELAALDDDALRAAAPVLDQRLRDCDFQTFVHGDAKLANFCFGETSVAAVDFQYVGGGCGISDVAYFLGSCWDDGFDPDERRHLDAYFAHLRRALPSSADAEAIEREWRALYPIAAADYYRFFAGWAKEQWAHELHGQRVVRDVLRTLH